MTRLVEVGSPLPFGATIQEKGVNFALFSEHACKITLCLLDPKTKEVFESIPLDPEKNKTGFVWHVFIPDLTLPVLYAYRIDGKHGSPFYYDPRLLLADPYAKVLDTTRIWGHEGKTYHPYSVAMQPPAFDWEGIQSPKIPMKDLVIYEMHVRGFTQHASSGVKHPGTFLGMLEKIPYLKELGVNAIELMPIQEFNERGFQGKNPNTQQELCNYWGYSSLHFFSPMMRYCVGEELGSALTEFKTMIREMHRHGIEVILDVVLNHTGEKRGHEQFLSFVGIDRACYYLLHNGADTNFTGCGNTVNMNHPMMHQFTIDCLRYWAVEMQVDGFRFDLASIFNRDQEGNLHAMSSLVGSLSYDPVLAKVKLIAEPWDAVGAYQLGGFFPKATRWSEWNGKYRDTIRRFIKGDHFTKNDFAQHISGSEGLFPLRSPQASINFVTAHDGFTLADLVAYEHKHNIENGESNRDGNSFNISSNHGIEGPTTDAKILALRERQMKNFLVALLFSQGVPLIFMGDEYGHTKKGNNNTWCQDNELNWFLWDHLGERPGFYQFVKYLIAFRKKEALLKKDHFLSEEEIVWHGIAPLYVDWDKEKSLIGWTLFDEKEHKDIYVFFNATNDSAVITLPFPPQGRTWRWIINTFAEPLKDHFEEGVGPVQLEHTLTVHSYSCIVLKAL